MSLTTVVQNTANRVSTFEFWAYGLISAFIGGGASAVTAAFTSSAVAPQEINLSDHLGNFLKVAAVSFVISGVLQAAAYLKQSPLPPIENPSVKDSLTTQTQQTT